MPKAPEEPVTQAVVDALLEYGASCGYTRAEMDELFWQRLHRRDWMEMVPFNVKFMRMIFKSGDKPRRVKKL